MSLIPSAEYASPSARASFAPGAGPHTTNGRTTQISEIVVQAGGEDRDRPSAARDTALGHLRAALTTVQDRLNEFLTERMRQGGASSGALDIEKRILDEGFDGELAELKRP
ncbi:EKC/KEOPS complex subunit GON7 [[Candida] zeylanoides]|jgi:protein GON7